MEKAYRNRNYILYVATFLLIYFSSAFSLSRYSGTTRMMLFAGLLAILMLYAALTRKSIKITIEILFVFLFGLLSYLLNGESLKQLTILLVYYTLTLFFINCFDYSEFIEAYCRIIYFLAVVSLVMYVLATFVPQVLTPLPVVSNSLGRMSYSVFFALSPFDMRNMGLFWEPGAFQTYLNIAIFFEIFRFRFQNKQRVAVLIVTLITTFSSAGFITIIFLAFTIVINQMIEKNLRKDFGFLLCIIMVAVIAVWYYVSFVDPALKYVLFGKLLRYAQDGNASSSTGVRVESIIRPFQLLFSRLQYIFIGMGPTKLVETFRYNYGHTMTTCTLANWFAEHGIFFGMLMLAGFYRLIRPVSGKTVTRLMLLIVFVLCTLSEDYVRNPSILVFIFYGLRFRFGFERTFATPKSESNYAMNQ